MAAGGTGWHGLEDEELVRLSLTANPPRRQEESERGDWKGEKGKTGWQTGGWGGGCHQNTTALLPNPPYSNITAQTSPARLRVGGGQRKGEHRKAKTLQMTLKLRPPLRSTTRTAWCHVTCSCERWPCGLFLLGGSCIFSWWSLAEVFDSKGVKLLSSQCQQGRMAHWGWRRSSYLVLHAVGKHIHIRTVLTHKYTHPSNLRNIFFNILLNALIF